MEKLTEKANTFQILTENGIEKKKAYSLAGYKGSSKKAIYEVEKRIKKHSVASPALVRLSKNAIRDTLQMLTSLQEVETAAGIKTVKVYPTHRGIGCRPPQWLLSGQNQQSTYQSRFLVVLMLISLI